MLSQVYGGIITWVLRDIELFAASEYCFKFYGWLGERQFIFESRLSNTGNHWSNPAVGTLQLFFFWDSILINNGGHLTLLLPSFPSTCHVFLSPPPSVHSGPAQRSPCLIFPGQCPHFFFTRLHSNTGPVTSSPDFCSSCTQNKGKKLWREGEEAGGELGDRGIVRGMRDMEEWGRK